MNIDPVNLTADLIRCKSITPKEAGALVLLEALLSKAGFECNRVDRGLVSNLFARWGSGRTLGFNGHTDVVPVGSINDWSVDPFGAEIKDGFLYGRGSTDMKSGVAAFAAAAIDFVQNSPPDGSIVLAITGDEEGQAVDGTVALLDWMNENKSGSNKEFHSMRKESSDHQIEKVGGELRNMMSWLGENKLVDKDKN